MKRVLVTGAGGFIGHHLVSYLKQEGYWVRGVDFKKPEYGKSAADEFAVLDLREAENCKAATAGMQEIYALAADMGGMGYISFHHAEILRNNALIDLHTLDAARRANVDRLLYASSACVYPEYRQTDTAVVPLKEEDAYPAQPQDAYGWEKLLTEQLCRYTTLENGFQTRVARLHNVFGPYGSWEGGREKAPAAICRKVAAAKLSGATSIEIWGDGLQTRSFCYVDDCVRALYMLMRSEHADPLNIGQDTLISINDLAAMVSEIAGWHGSLVHIPGPQGVRGRNCDSTRVRQVLGWTPKVSLREGMQRTYAWIEQQVAAKLRIAERAKVGSV